MTYQLTTGNTILRLEDGAFIPPDPANVDYQAYLAWCAAGNEPEPAPEPPAPPPPLTAAERLEAAGFSIDELRALLLETNTKK